MRYITSAICAAVFLLAANAANATMAEWCFYGDYTCADNAVGNSDTGLTSKSYLDTNGVHSVTVAGFVWDGGPDLFNDPHHIIENNRGVNDLGLGISSSGDTGTGELDSKNGTEFLRIDLGIDLQGLTDWMIMFSSVDGKEGVGIFTSDIAEPTVVQLVPGLLGDFFETNTYIAINPMRYLFIVEAGTPVHDNGINDDVLLRQLKATAVPEPATMALLGLGLLGLGFLRRGK